MDHVIIVPVIMVPTIAIVAIVAIVFGRGAVFISKGVRFRIKSSSCNDDPTRDRNR